MSSSDIKGIVFRHKMTEFPSQYTLDFAIKKAPAKTHMPYCKKYKPYILKYKAHILKYVPCIFRKKSRLIFSSLQNPKNNTLLEENNRINRRTKRIVGDD